MIAYLQTTACRSVFLVSYFGEEHPSECGVCDNCVGGKVAATSPMTDEVLVQRVLDFIAKEKVTSIVQIHFPDVPDSRLGELLHRMMKEELLPPSLT